MPPRVSLAIELLSESLSVCRLAAEAPLPPWTPSAASFCSVTRTANELSLICATAALPPGETFEAREDGWRALRLVGPFAFTEVGILLKVAVPLAAAGVSILPVATYDTDYVLVRETQLPRAVAELRAAGHAVDTGRELADETPRERNR